MRAAILAFCVISTPVWALDCRDPDPVQSYLEVDASADRWGAVVGRLDFDPARLPGADLGQGRSRPRVDTELRAQLVGHSLGADGFTNVFQGNVTLVVQCAAQWCGTAKSGGRYLVFLKREAARHVAYATPCGGLLFANPGRWDLDRLQSCFNGGHCDVD